VTAVSSHHLKAVPHSVQNLAFSGLFAQSLGVGTTWIGGTMNRDAFEKAIGLSAGEMDPSYKTECVTELSP